MLCTVYCIAYIPYHTNKTQAIRYDTINSAYAALFVYFLQAKYKRQNKSAKPPAFRVFPTKKTNKIKQQISEKGLDKKKEVQKTTCIVKFLNFRISFRSFGLCRVPFFPCNVHHTFAFVAVHAYIHAIINTIRRTTNCVEQY